MLTTIVASTQSLVVNELSQGVSGSEEYVELLVVGTPSCGDDCLDLRGWIIDDNNGSYGAGSGKGIAPGCMRFSQNPIWECVKYGTLILIYNDQDKGGAIPADNLTGAGCQFIIPANSTLFETNPVDPSTSTGSAYPTTGFVGGGDWNTIGMRNGGDSFQTLDPSDLTTAAHAVSYGDNSNAGVHFAGSMGGNVIYMANTTTDDYDDVNNWLVNTASTDETPGSSNSVANATWINMMSNNCSSASMNVTVSQTDIQCEGDNNGQVTVTPTGGTSPISYNWSTGQTSNSITGLAGGSFTITVVDATGTCSVTETVTITEPAQLSVSLNCADVSAPGGNDGASSSTVGGGAAAYNYLWNTGATQASLTNLSAGNYSLTVTDNNGCVSSASCAVNEPNCTATMSSTVTDVICNGEATGGVQTSLFGGVSPYTFSWSNGATTQSISSVTANNYLLTATDATGCSLTINETIDEPSAITISTATFDESCAFFDGSAAASVQGGESNYTFNWSTGGTNSSITGLAAGNYQLTVTDNNGCEETGSVTVSLASNITVTSNVTPTSCFSGSDGIAGLTVNGGSVPYTYLWSTGQTNSTITGQSSSVVSYTVTDASSCSSSGQTTITEPAQLGVTITGQNPSCAGACDGLANANVTGGVSPYSYNWSNGNIGVNASLLCANVDYFVTVSDNFGCEVSGSVSLTEPSAITLTFGANDATCNSMCDGFAIVAASGGNSGYSYSWSAGISSSNQLASNLCDGSYGLTVTDNQGCFEVENFTISEPLAMSVTSATVTNSNCGQNDGKIEVLSVQGGNSTNYTYDWHNGGTNSSLNNQSAGTYCVDISDPSSTAPGGCFITFCSTITDVPGPSFVVGASDISCNGFCDGSASATVTNNGGSTDYSFAWGNTNQTSSNVTGLCSGSIGATVTDGNGCSSSTSFNISEPSIVSVTASTSDNTVCFGACSNLSAMATGGTPPYSFNWDIGSGANQQGCPTDYTFYAVSATDANGCESMMAFVAVDVYPELNGSAYGNTTICDGESTNLGAFASGGTGGPYFFSWGNLGGFGSEVTVTPQTYPADAIYVVTITDACSYAVTDTVIVDFHPTPEPLFSPIIDAGCEPFQTTITPIQSSIQDAIACVWETGDGQLYYGCDEIPHLYTAPGNYDVTFTAVSQENCSGTFTWPNAITVYEKPVADFYSSPNPTDVFNTKVYFEDRSEGFVNQWDWTFFDSENQIGTVGGYNPSFTFPADTGTYPVKLETTTMFGCKDDTIKNVVITGKFKFYIPTAFTPNGDGDNDIFMPKGTGVDGSDYKFMIYDRWGELIFVTETWGEGWDGIAKEVGATEYAPDGIYVWKIFVKEGTTRFKDNYTRLGTVTLLR